MKQVLLFFLMSCSMISASAEDIYLYRVEDHVYKEVSYRRYHVDGLHLSIYDHNRGSLLEQVVRSPNRRSTTVKHRNGLIEVIEYDVAPEALAFGECTNVKRTIRQEQHPSILCRIENTTIATEDGQSILTKTFVTVIYDSKEKLLHEVTSYHDVKKMGRVIKRDIRVTNDKGAIVHQVGFTLVAIIEPLSL